MSMQIVVPGPVTNVDATARVALGTKAQDATGGDFIYLQGVAATVAGDLVVYSDAYLTTRSVAASTGPAAFAMAAVLASQFGWYRIGGDMTGIGAGAFPTPNVPVGRTATAGNVAPTSATNTVFGVYVRAATGGAGPVTLRIVHPPHIVGVAP